MSDGDIRQILHRPKSFLSLMKILRCVSVSVGQIQLFSIHNHKDYECKCKR